ncbi:MAG TPA: glycosyltransferase [Candidatus Eisenbergiella pullicola]|nr:glycosyltransferase [Candidatus Eisenbergiella pullicola]
MLEKDYWISNFDEKFRSLKGKKIAVYGSGINAKEILNRFSDYDFLCLVDDKAAGTYINGYAVIKLEEMFELGAEYLIIAAKTRSAEAVYQRIGAECRINRVKVYNLYGNDMHALHADIIRKKANYGRIGEDFVKTVIDAHDVISFDFDNTLFVSKKIKIFEVFQEIEKQLLDQGINIYYFANKAWRFKCENPSATFEHMLEYLVRQEGVDVDLLGEIWGIVYEKIENNLQPRKAVFDMLHYALKCGKHICVIEDAADYRMPKKIWKRLLESCGVDGGEAVICSSEFAEDKYIGLFRELKAQFEDASILHIGDELTADVLVPQLYGIDTFWVKNPVSLYKEFESLTVGPLENKSVRQAYQDYLLATYTDDYTLNKIEMRRKENNSLLKRLGRRVEFCQNCEEDIYDGTVIYDPVLFEDLVIVDDIEIYPKLRFPSVDKPVVSIIVPVYNQFAYTYNCLRSILEHTMGVAYEVIVADDCSTDQVSELEKVVTGINVLHNNENLKFLLNCNNAANYARGEYILFLNNDTQVQPNWLKPLVELLEKRTDVGMVGSKLVYPDGCLQEAGGILWKDGSAWNYGHRKNPTSPEYCYVKEVDYISGASIMIRSSLWKEIGGFDVTFAPAYYEDTDLAFEVRRQGYKVLFQPESIVVHFEGVSNGTDLAAGLKRYQIANQNKFFEKWKDVLQKHLENGRDVYLAKDRGQTKKQILVVDHYVPNYDKDAGGRCTFMYLKAFLELEMKVTFIGDNFAKMEPYTTILTQMGIEVLYGDYYCLHWQEWLKDNLQYFDYIYLQRPHISIKYIDIVKKYGRGKIFYFAHDLHHIRFYREYQLTGDVKALEESKKWEKIEIELFEKADVGHVVGSYEQKILQEKFRDRYPNKPIRNIPLYIYDQLPNNINKDFSTRKDILFVGGFNHAPNIDAVLWFAKEIFPVLLKRYADLRWHIVGSNAPQEVRNIECDNIILEGFVNDQRLEELYEKCRMAVVPLRYGAGVKGKVVEAAYYQIPLVTTSIGGEGLDTESNAFVIEDNASEMASRIIHLYTDYEALRKMSDAGKAFIQKYFTTNAAKEVLLKDMEI